MSEAGLCVDGVLGTGVQGAPRGTAAAAIRWIGRCRERQAVVAIDLPSGMDGLTGRVAGDAVAADLTVTMAFPKQGMLTPEGQARCGAVEVVDIGVPAALAAELPPAPELLCAPVLRARLVRRSRAAHKGSCGHVLVIGGARGYSGAVALAAGGALRSGAGLVSVLTTEWSRAVLAAVPEVMVRTGPTTPEGVLLPAALADAPGALTGFDAIVAGPGLGNQAASRELVMELLRCEGVRLVLDADALNVLGADLGAVRGAAAEVILTPHPGEASRLLGTDTASIQTDRRGALQRLCSESGATVALKGQGTWVGAPGADDAICLAGNPGLATGGTGDVLSGIIGGLAAQGAGACDAARLGVYLHATAGDLAARRGSEAGLTAGELVATLPTAIRHLYAR